MNTRDEMVIRAALAELPSTCRYHGDEIEGRDLWRFAGACCATGQPALMRRRALAALYRNDPRRSGRPLSPTDASVVSAAGSSEQASK